MHMITVLHTKSGIYSDLKGVHIARFSYTLLFKHRVLHVACVMPGMCQLVFSCLEYVAID